MRKLDYQWDFTEENFRRMMAHEMTPDIYGSVRVGLLLIEFRCTGGGMDPGYHVPTNDVFVYGKDEDDVPHSNYTVEYMRDGTPYLLLDDEIRIPQRRSFDTFKAEFEVMIGAWLCTDGKAHLSEALEPTVSYSAWNPAEPKEEEIRIKTRIGTLIAKTSHDDLYPSISVWLERNGKTFEYAIVETDQSDEADQILKSHIYSPDVEEDEPIFDNWVKPAEIDKYLNDMYGEEND